MKTFFALTRKAFRWERLLALLSAIAIPIYFAKAYFKGDYTDFSVYYLAAHRFLEGNFHQIYNIGDGASPFRYPPPTIPFFLFFALFKKSIAQTLWCSVQIIFFSLTYVSLGRTLRPFCNQSRFHFYPLAFLLIFRLILDTLSIGQVSSLLLFGLSIGLEHFIFQTPFKSGFGLSIPILFKIGPGAPALVWLNDKPIKNLVILLCSGFFFVGGLTAVLFLWMLLHGGHFEDLSRLFEEWILIVKQDSTYFDAAHYGSQSLKSVLLRLGIDRNEVETFYPHFLFVSAFSYLVVCLRRSLKSSWGRYSLYCLGIFLFLVGMPETFKYSMTALVFPAALVLTYGTRHIRFGKAGIIAVLLFISLPAKDFLPDSIFFGIQTFNLPFVAICLLFLATLEIFWKESEPKPSFSNSNFVWPASSVWQISKTLKQAPVLERTYLVAIPFSSNLTGSRQLQNLQKFLYRLNLLTRDPNGIEVVICPYFESSPRVAPSKIKTLQSKINILLQKFPTLSCSQLPLSLSLPESILNGLGVSRGKWIDLFKGKLWIDPAISTEFSPEENSLTLADRRHLDSTFEVPVITLGALYPRSIAGRLFRAFSSLFFPQTRDLDPLSGYLGVEKHALLKALSRVQQSGFLFELDLILCLLAQNLKVSSLPCAIWVEHEKSWSTILEEGMHALSDFPKMILAHKRPQSSPISPLKLNVDDWGMLPSINEACLRLVELGLVKRVSILTNTKYFETGLSELITLQKQGKVTLGLHFNLTYGPSLSPPPSFLLRGKTLGRILQFAALGTQDEKRNLFQWAQYEADLQLKKAKQNGVHFEYVDGHQHVHLAPGMLRALSNVFRSHGIEQTRIAYDPKLFLSSKFLIPVLSYFSRRDADISQLRYNKFIYPSINSFITPDLLGQEWAEDPYAEVLCHPAAYDDFKEQEDPDPYKTERLIEMQGLLRMAVLLS